MRTPKPSDAERPTPQASPMQDCRNSWLPRCDAVRPRPVRRRTRSFPFLFPSPAASMASPTDFRRTPRPVAKENLPSCSWPCAAPPRRPPQHVLELSFSIEHLRLWIGNPATRFCGFRRLLVCRRCQHTEVARYTHVFSPFSSARRSTYPPGPLSSPTTSRNPKALACPAPSLGRKVRNVSRIAPCSQQRVTAITAPGG